MDACSRLHPIRATRSGALRATFIGRTGFSARLLPRSCDRRCPGQPDRGNPAPLTSNREGAAPSWPQTPVRLLISQQPGWSLLQKPKEQTPPDQRSHATRATSGQLQRGVPWIRGRARGSCSIATVRRSVSPSLAKAGEAGRPSRSQAPRPLETTVFGETVVKAGSAHQPPQGSFCCARRATRGVRSRFTPLPTAENAAGEGALPGRTLDQGSSQDRAEHVPRETRVTRGPAEALAASSNAASTDASRKSNDPPGARVRGQLQTLTRHIFPLGHGRPKGRQQTKG